MAPRPKGHYIYFKGFRVISTSTMHHYGSGPTLPVEAYTLIVRYLAADIRSLRNISLVCRRLRIIAQSILFSSIVFTGEETDKVLLTLESKDNHILSHIRTVSFIYRPPSLWLTEEDDSGTQLLKLITVLAKDLRAVQIGPFYFHQYATEDEKDLIVSPCEFDDVDYRLSDSPEPFSTFIAEVFPKLEKIVLEDVWSVPAENVRQWRSVKTLQVPSTGLIIWDSSDSSRSFRIPKDQEYSLPAPTVLTVSGDVESPDKPYEWRGYSISFEQVKDLRMEIMGDGEYYLFNTIMKACHHKLESLRLFIFRDPWEQVLDLSGLSSLKSLYFIIFDLANPIKVLAKILNWLNVHDLASLEEICLYIHVNKERSGYWLLQIIEEQESKHYKMFWRMINKKLGEIFVAKKRIRVSIKFPPSDDLSWEKILEYVHEVMPSTKDQNFQLEDTKTGSQAILQLLFTRHDEKVLGIIRRKIAEECRDSILRGDNEPCF